MATTPPSKTARRTWRLKLPVYKTLLQSVLQAQQICGTANAVNDDAAQRFNDAMAQRHAQLPPWSAHDVTRHLHTIQTRYNASPHAIPASLHRLVETYQSPLSEMVSSPVASTRVHGVSTTTASSTYTREAAFAAYFCNDNEPLLRILLDVRPFTAHLQDADDVLLEIVAFELNQEAGRDVWNLRTVRDRLEWLTQFDESMTPGPAKQLVHEYMTVPVTVFTKALARFVAQHRDEDDGVAAGATFDDVFLWAARQELPFNDEAHVVYDKCARLATRLNALLLENTSGVAVFSARNCRDRIRLLWELYGIERGWNLLTPSQRRAIEWICQQWATLQRTREMEHRDSGSNDSATRTRRVTPSERDGARDSDSSTPGGSTLGADEIATGGSDTSHLVTPARPNGGAVSVEGTATRIARHKAPPVRQTPRHALDILRSESEQRARRLVIRSMESQASRRVTPYHARSFRQQNELNRQRAELMSASTPTDDHVSTPRPVIRSQPVATATHALPRPTELDAIRRALAALHDENATKTEHITRLRTTVQMLQAADAKKATQIAQLRETVTTQQHRLDVVKFAFVRETSVLKADNTMHLEETAQLHDELRKLQAREATTNQQLTELTYAVASLRQHIDVQSATIEAIQTVVDAKLDAIEMTTQNEY